MKIINNYISFNKINSINTKRPYSFQNVINCDSFTKSTPVSFKSSVDLSPILDKNYEDMTKEEKSILRQELEPCDLDIINDCINAATLIKAVYDEKYGENNWEYIAIGRSCSIIANTLKCFGINTHILPISGLQKGILHGEDLTKQDGFNNYRQFIYDQGLTPENIENSGKTYIFQDYCDQGNSIRIFEEFIRSKEMNLDKDNIVFESINDVLYNNIPKLFDLNMRDFNPIVFLRLRLASQYNAGSLKSYTGTPKLHYKDLERIEELKDKKPLNMYRIFNFGIEDQIKSGKN